jgi:PAS domain S-box-containing protein
MTHNKGAVESELMDEVEELRKRNSVLEAEASVRTQTVAALLESKERYRNLFETMAQGVVYQSADGEIISANPAAERILGFSHDELLGKMSTDTCWQSITEEGAPLPGEDHPSMVSLRTGKQVSDFIMGVHNPKDGRYRWLHVTAIPQFKTGESEPYQVFTTFIDITELKRAQEALLENERKYRQLVNHAPTAIYEVDLRNRRYISVNDLMCEITGYSREELLEMDPLDLLTEEGKKLFTERITKLVAGEEVPEVVEYRVRLKGGREIWTILNTKIMRDENGGIRATVVGHDISARKRMEEALRESEEKYRLLVENATDAIFIAQDGVVKYSNPITLKLIEYSEDELAKIPFVSIIHPEDRDMVMDRHLRRLHGENPPSTYSFRVITKNGAELWVQANAIAITWEGRPATLNFLRDITKLRQLESKIGVAQRMESLGTLAGGIAHDFNNLLMGIQGRTSLMLSGIDRSHLHYEHLTGIEEYVQSAAELTRQLLGLARGGKYEVKPLSLNEVVRKSSDMFGRTKKEITIHHKYEPHVWSVEADQGQLEQVLINILVNAWQAMPGGGDIYMETRNARLDETFTGPYGAEPGKYVQVSVVDTGMGMDETTMEHVFDPFFTTKERGRGTGLGLAAAYGIVKNHGGIITVESKQGRGSSFTIFLPASDKEVCREMEDSEGVIHGTGTVLLVDDEQVIIEVGRELLTELGYDVLVARSGGEAVDIYRSRGEDINLVILDLIMPDMSGGQTFDRLRKLDSSVTVLLSSGYSLDGEAKDILDRGCNGFIQKPFNIESLSRKLQELRN